MINFENNEGRRIKFAPINSSNWEQGSLYGIVDGTTKGANGIIPYSYYSIENSKRELLVLSIGDYKVEFI